MIGLTLMTDRLLKKLTMNKENKMKVKCLNCGHDFELNKLYKDELGDFTVCPECEGSFDVDIETDDNDLN